MKGSVFSWAGPAKIRNRRTSRPQPFFHGLKTPTNKTGSITITGRSQGEADTDRRASIKRGGV